MCRRQKGLDVQVHYRPSRNGLHLHVDSTGIKFLGEGEWKTKKHGAERRRQWRKVHLGIDAATLQIRAIVVTTNEVGDSPVAAELLAQIPSGEAVASSQAMERTTHKTCMKPVTTWEPSPSFLHVKERGYAKELHLRIATKRSKRVDNCVELFGKTGVDVTADLW